MRNVLVVGAGFSGAVIARELAEKAGAHVHVLESRTHIAGNCHTERDAVSGVMLHVYGPHIFNTDLQHVWDYVNRFATFHPFTNRVKATIDRGVFSLPINLHTINQFFGRRFNPAEARAFIGSVADRSIGEPANFEEQALKMIGRELYEAFFQGYTAKQWGCDPRELPASILKRLPIRFNYDDNYYATRLQGIPEDGYSTLIARILDHPKIEVSLRTHFERGMEIGYDHLVYTGPVDAFFGCELGRLRYRTVTFERIDAQGDYQGNAVINFPGLEVRHTRVHEHKHFAPSESHERTVAFREFSEATRPGDIPYYPLRLECDLMLLHRYQQLGRSLSRVTFAGRLGTYSYLDMDDVIDESLQIAADLLSRSRPVAAGRG